jgi:hypothetical protein
LNENGKSVQWHTAKTPKANEPSRLYSESDCSYFGLVLIPFEEIWWIPVLEIGGRTSICTKIKKDFWQFIAETRRVSKGGIRSGIDFLIFIKQNNISKINRITPSFKGERVYRQQLKRLEKWG